MIRQADKDKSNQQKCTGLIVSQNATAPKNANEGSKVRCARIVDFFSLSLARIGVFL